MKRAIVSGFIARHPIGGNTWCYLQYALGLERLGYDVYYLEDSQDLLCYDPGLNVTDINYSYCIEYLRSVMKRVGLGDKWAYRIGDKCYGMSERELVNLCKNADLLVNVSGALLLGSLPSGLITHSEYEYFGKKVFVDQEPAYTQFKYARDPDSPLGRSLARHDVHFTVGLNIGEADCLVPTSSLEWKKTQRPIVLDMWPPNIDPALEKFTTVTNWSDTSGFAPIESVTYNGETYQGSKVVEFSKFLDLPKLSNQKVELAIAAGVKPEILLKRGWNIVDARVPTKDPWTYRQYISNSRGEWSVAKNNVVKSRSGWFSDRSACYLAAAKPVLIQDTGFSKYLPTGEGLIAFDDMDGALEGIAEINNDYEKHCKVARRIAEKYFDSDIVLKDLLQQSGI